MNPPLNPVELAQSSSFDIQGAPRLVFGSGVSARAGELAKSVGGRHALLVTDAGILHAGHAARMEHALRAAGLEVTVFSGVRENPTTGDVDACLAVAREAGIDCLVGLGGGSSLDTAKGTNFVLTNGGSMQDYWGVGRAAKPMLPLLAIPTTAGTGSEMQCAALIADEHTHQKMACLDPKALPRVALLDPQLTLSQPPRVAACTGLDALAHALETAVTTKRTPESAAFSHEAFHLCSVALPLVLTAPDDLPARARMQLGAAFGGAAIERSMLGAAHAAANPLTAHFGAVHGAAVGLMLPPVIRFNAVDSAARAAYEALGLPPAELARLIESLLALARLPRSLAELGIARQDIPRLADEAAKQWTAGFNPRSVAMAEFVGLYEAVFVPPQG
jgi:alcohol dehydrogenase